MKNRLHTLPLLLALATLAIPASAPACGGAATQGEAIDGFRDTPLLPGRQMAPA